MLDESAKRLRGLAGHNITRGSVEGIEETNRTAKGSLRTAECFNLTLIQGYATSEESFGGAV